MNRSPGRFHFDRDALKFKALPFPEPDSKRAAVFKKYIPDSLQVPGFYQSGNDRTGPAFLELGSDFLDIKRSFIQNLLTQKRF